MDYKYITVNFAFNSKSLINGKSYRIKMVNDMIWRLRLDKILYKDEQDKLTTNGRDFLFINLIENDGVAEFCLVSNINDINIIKIPVEHFVKGEIEIMDLEVKGD